MCPVPRRAWVQLSRSWRVSVRETPLTRGGSGLPGALRSWIGTPPDAALAGADKAVPSARAEEPTTEQLFEQAVRDHARRLLAIARAVVGHRASPEDVVQQALVNLYQHRDRYDWHQPGGLLRRAGGEAAAPTPPPPRMAAWHPAAP